MLSRAFLLTKKALQNLAADFWLNVTTVLVIALALLLLGAFMVVAYNASLLVDHFAGRVEVMIYFKDTHSQADVQNLTAQLKSDPSVASVQYVSKAEALQRFKEQLAELSDLTDDMEENPLPASLEVQLKEGFAELPDLEVFAARFGNNPSVEEVYYGREWVTRLSRAVSFIWLIGSAVGMFLAATAVFIISTTLRLAIHRRSEEIGVMRLVGATTRFIRMPFILEGLAQGFFGAALSLVCLYGVYLGLARGLFLDKVALVPFFPGFDPQFLPINASLALLGMGLVVGLFGSLLSTGKYLKV